MKIFGKQFRVAHCRSQETSEIYLTEIYDMKGERLFSSQVTAQQTYNFSLTGYPAGIYLVRVIGEKSSGTTRVIKN